MLKLQYLATWCKELTHWKRPWCWERLKAGGEGENREWDGWMASPTQWTWVWASSGSWWRTGKPGMLQSMGSQRVGHDWVTELNWGRLIIVHKPYTQGIPPKESPGNQLVCHWFKYPLSGTRETSCTRYQERPETAGQESMESRGCLKPYQVQRKTGECPEPLQVKASW